jgi:anti-sigma factor RsiW
MDLQALPPGAAQDHPPDRALTRYVANEMGPARKRKLSEHLQQCSECRNRVGKIREFARRFRDFERVAIMHAAMPPCSRESAGSV